MTHNITHLPKKLLAAVKNTAVVTVTEVMPHTFPVFQDMVNKDGQQKIAQPLRTPQTDADATFHDIDETG